MMDDLLLQAVDAKVADMPNEHVDDANLIRNVQVTNEWIAFRE